MLAPLAAARVSPPAPVAPATEPGGTAQADTPGVAATPPEQKPRGGLRLPPRPVSAALVLVFLGFGVLLGHVAGSRVPDSLVAARSPLKLELPASTGEQASTAQTTAASGEAEPPSSEPEATPPPAATKQPASTSTSTQPSEESSKESASESSEAGSSGAGAGEPAKKLPPIKHVFMIMLADEPYASAFGPASSAPYLVHKLEKQGELLPHYDAVAHEGLADELAVLSGQGPTLETAANCPNYTEIASSGTGPDEQVLGNGCVYPRATPTLLSQLEAKHLTWRAYVQGIDETGTAAPACAHPSLGQPDPTSQPAATAAAYSTFHNPFVYFAAIADSPGCASDDVGLTALKGDLASAKSTPSFLYIAPDSCDDGSPTPCGAGAQSGMVAANSFLQTVVPEITGSKAYKEAGLLVITVDAAPSSGEFADSSSCCGQPLFPNAPSKTPAGAPRGGGSVGALLLSPYVKGGSSNGAELADPAQEPYNHFSLLRTIEDLFGLGHIGYAALPNVKSFEPALFLASKAKG